MRKNRILIVIGSFKTGGAERMAITMGAQWSREGYDVHYALLRPVFEIPHDIPDDRIHLISDRKGHSTPIQHLFNLFKVFRLNRKLNVDVVIGFTYFSSFVGCFTLCRKVIGTFDVDPYQFIWKRSMVADFVMHWPFVRYIVCPSEGLYEQIVERKPKFRKKGIAIYNTIDMEGIKQLGLQESPLSGELSQKKYICGMGRFSNQKNFPLLLNAYAKSRIRHDYDLVLIGDGPQMEPIREITRDLKITDKVHFTGFLANPFPVIARSELFVNTSNYESFCIVLLEALILNIPVIATDCKSGPGEIIQHDVNGLLTPVKDAEKLTGLMDQISSNESKLDDLRKNIPESIQKFYPDSIATKWERIIA